MNYTAMKRSAVAAGIGLAMWYGAGWAKADTKPTMVLRDAMYIGPLESIIQDAENTRSGFGLAGRIFTYAGLIGFGASLFHNPNKPKKKE